MKIIKSITFLSILMIANLLSSCTDSCNKKLGDTFNSVEVNSTIHNASNQNVILTFNTYTLSDLPEQYFVDGTLYDPKVSASNNEVESFSIASNKIEIELSETQAVSLGETKLYEFQVHFGDRRTYIDCKHPGMADSYQLNLKFDLTKTNTGFDISNFSWEEFHSAGSI